MAVKYIYHIVLVGIVLGGLEWKSQQREDMV